MRRFEFGVALLLTGFGVRSLWYWARRPFGSTAIRDQLLYAVYRTGRVGLWFAFAGLFYLFAFVGASDPEPNRITGEKPEPPPSDVAEKRTGKVNGSSRNARLGPAGAPPTIAV